LEYSMTPPGSSVTRSSPRRSSMTLVPSYTGDHPYCDARSYKMSRIPGSASYGTRLRSDRCTRKYSSSTPRRKSLGAVMPAINGTRRCVSSRLLAITSTLQGNSGMMRHTPSGPEGLPAVKIAYAALLANGSRWTIYLTRSIPWTNRSTVEYRKLPLISPRRQGRPLFQGAGLQGSTDARAGAGANRGGGSNVRDGASPLHNLGRRRSEQRHKTLCHHPGQDMA